MESQRRALSLVVLTLLQLCRAEIKDVQQQWYSANVINDGFQPKSISELFTTEASFSTANPIIVSSKDNNDDIRILSTSATPSPTSPTSSTTNQPIYNQSTSNQSSQLSSLSQNQSPLSQFSSSLPPFQQYIPMTNQNQQPYQQMSQSSIEIQQQTSLADFEIMQPVQPLLKMVSDLQGQPQRNVQIQQEHSTPILPQNPSEVKLTTFYQPQPTEISLPQDTRFGLMPQNGQNSIRPESTSSSPTFSTISSIPMTTRTPSMFYSSTWSPTQYLSSPSSPRVTITPLSTTGSSSSISNTGSTRTLNCMLPKLTTPVPRLENSRPIPIDQLFPLKIRVLAPSGSIMNLNFNNPTAKPHALSTKKYIAYTTTRKPTTRRTPKPKKNTYERCLQGCRKNGQPLCAAPLSQFPVDPKTLRGFSSVCHMACHNSYRKDAFEKLIDGNCSKLRTRIRPIDTDSKLKRDELQKLQYYLDNSGPQAILEFTGPYS